LLCFEVWNTHPQTLRTMDYSKWDKYAAELSDSDDEGQKPVVNTVGAKEAVKLGPSGYEIGSTISKPTLAASGSKGSINLDENQLTMNGAKGDIYYWRQDRQEVILTVVLPSGVRGKDVALTFNAATKVLSISAQGVDILSRPLRYGININNMVSVSGDKNKLVIDPEDWEVKTVPFDSSDPNATLEETRILELSLRKVSPLPGAIFWWRNCFEGEKEIDVTKIAGRPGVSQEEQLKEDPFAIAHKMFLEKMKNKEKVEVDFSES